MATKAQLQQWAIALSIDTTDMSVAQIESALSDRLQAPMTHRLPDVIRANIRAIRDALAGR